jgi:hypothetical protein
MKPTNILLLIAVLIAAMLHAPPAYAHCDTLDGPVAKAGERALESSNLDYALVWIKPEAEPELRAAFKQALAVRTLNKEARELADRYFLETLVRLHRAGEGEPYTGLKPRGTDLGPAIPAADQAIRSASTTAVTKLITEATTHGLRERLERVIATRKYKPNDITAGREHVEAYVAFLHYVERLYVDAGGSATDSHGHENH